MHKAGYVTIIGKPNAGKSTLLNAFLKQKLSITNNKPQTTRKSILGILSENEYQIIFQDTPGIIEPRYLLQKRMMDFYRRALDDADLILFLIEPDDPLINHDMKTLPLFQDIFVKLRTKIVAIINKVDLIDQSKTEFVHSALEKTGLFDKIFAVSALHKFGTDELLRMVVTYLPEGPKYYPDDIVSSEPEKFFVSEIIREKILELYQDEIPYSCEVVIDEFKERDKGKDLIRAVIVAEKDSQKGILIGAKGAAIKRLGESSRKEIEEFLEREVFLELRVKVRQNWRSDEKFLRQFGYDIPKDE
ncbi:MAG: GTPase Era [Ignavibacteriaceae bacterium]|nr:GTPase Era [Ignavibacteriaceae bacterium]